MKPVTQQSAVELLALLNESKISPLELADEYIGQIESLNPRLNALIDFDADRVREQDACSGALKRAARPAVRAADDHQVVNFCRWLPL